SCASNCPGANSLPSAELGGKDPGFRSAAPGALSQERAPRGPPRGPRAQHRLSAPRASRDAGGSRVRSEPRLGGPRGGRIRAAKGRGGEAGCCRLPAPSLREEAPAARSWRGPRGARGEGEAPASPAGAGGAVGPDQEQEEEERRTSGGEGGPGLAAGPTSRLELPLGPQEPAALGRAPPARQQGLPGRGGEQPRVL
ncbi:unnamed protein product, partial [Prorocentrum cordatum]